jgi:hypothetical protein
MWRAIYLAEEGAEWGMLDYAQQEPRHATDTALRSGPERLGRAVGSQRRGQEAYDSAVDAQRRYFDDPSMDPHTMFVLMVEGDAFLRDPGFKQRRKILKNTYLGICYGEGGPKMCRDLGYPTKIIENERTGRRAEVAGDEGQALLNLIDQRVPYVRATARAVEAVARERGYIVTQGGRHLHFPKDQWGNFDFTYRAFNRRIQGGAADQTKTAMVELDRAGAWLQLQVHDEFDLPLESRAQGEGYARIMEECFPLLVPSKVDLEMGPDWGNCH